MAATSAAALRAEVRSAVAAARGRLERFLALPEGAGFSELVRAYDEIRRPIARRAGRLPLLSAVHPEREMRDAAEALEIELEAFETELSLHRGAYERLAALEGADAPDAKQARLCEHALRDFRRAGVDRDEATRERVRALKQELVAIGQEFDRNIVEGRRELRLEQGHVALAGLPDDYLAAHPEAGDGSVTLSTDWPDYLPFMLYAERGDLRERFFHEHKNRAFPENLAVLSRLLERRHELASLLGYASWAEYITEDKMVRRPEAAREFIERVAGLARPRADAECAELLREKRRNDPGATELYEHETGFLTERVKRARFDFDSQAVRAYFAYDEVERGVLATSARLYGVEFRENHEAEVWHESVACFDLLDGGERIARFYLDMFPREGKYQHAAMFDLCPGIRGETIPEAALVCNFPRPADGEPALLLHSQVTTFFHEFGHLLHHLFAAEQEYLRFAGLTTEWDFVEVPSQLYEEWAWDSGVLASFATHHETGEPIPAELVERLRAAEEYGKGLAVSRQMLLAMFSLSLYERDPAGLDTTAHLAELERSMSPLARTEGTHLQASFGHLTGYSALYYTYMWSLVIAKDLFAAFGEDLMDRAGAERYRRTVLAPGGSRDASELVRDQLGREYAFDAWEAWLRR